MVRANYVFFYEFNYLDIIKTMKFVEVRFPKIREFFRDVFSYIKNGSSVIDRNLIDVIQASLDLITIKFSGAIIDSFEKYFISSCKINNSSHEGK